MFLGRIPNVQLPLCGPVPVLATRLRLHLGACEGAAVCLSGVIIYSMYLEGTWFYTIWLIDILVEQPLFWGNLPKDHKQENLSSASQPVGE